MVKVAIGCAESRSLLSDLLDGEVAASLAGPLRAHLRRCGSCRQLLAALGQLRAWLRDASTPVSSPPHL